MTQAMPVDNAIHLCVDMQRIFVRNGLWETSASSSWKMRDAARPMQER
jgi:hypothetical protein